MQSLIRLMGGLAMAAVLTACGGGGGSAGAVPGQSTSPDALPTTKVTDFAVFTSKTSLTNSGTDSVIVTVTAVDAARNSVRGATVTVATDKGAIFTPTSTGGVTDDTGSYSGRLTFGADRTDRAINISVLVNGIVRNTTVQVKGSKVTLQVSPSNPTPGSQVLLTAVVTDAAGVAIPNASIGLGGTLPSVSGQTLTSNVDGKATRTFAAPTANGIYQVNASASGVSSGDSQVQVFSALVPPVVLPTSVAPALSASPNVVAVNSPGTSASRSTLRLILLDPQNRPIPNVRVRFFDTTTGLPTVGSVLSDAGKTLYTNASGIVTTEYIAGQNPSPTNGVSFRACFSGDDFTAPDACPNAVNTTLTVAGQALSVSIGDDNLLEKGPGTYIKRFVVTVADSAGKPVANAPVDLSVDLTHYGKFNFSPGYVSAAVSSLFVPSNLTAAASFPVSITSTTGGTATQVTGTFTWCANEDTNRNGFVDPGENINGSVDSNNQATLEPRKSDLLVSYENPLVTTTNASGILQIKVEYSQRFATWVAYKLRLLASVQGSQGLAERAFVTNFIEGDQQNGSFLVAPYGFNSSCASPN